MEDSPFDPGKWLVARKDHTDAQNEDIKIYKNEVYMIDRWLIMGGIPCVLLMEFADCAFPVHMFLPLVARLDPKAWFHREIRKYES